MGASAPLQSESPMRNTFSMSHLGQFLYRGHIWPLLTRNLISCDMGASAPLQSESPMGNTFSMSHLGQFLYRGHIWPLLTRNFICCDKPQSAALQSTPPMGRASSTIHRWFFYTNSILGFISRKHRPWLSLCIKFSPIHKYTSSAKMILVLFSPDVVLLRFSRECDCVVKISVESS